MNRRGFALLAVLWVVTALTALTGAGMLAARLGSETTRNRILLTRARSGHGKRALRSCWPDLPSIPRSASSARSTWDAGPGVVLRWRIQVPDSMSTPLTESSDATVSRARCSISACRIRHCPTIPRHSLRPEAGARYRLCSRDTSEAVRDRAGNWGRQHQCCAGRGAAHSSRDIGRECHHPDESPCAADRFRAPMSWRACSRGRRARHSSATTQSLCAQLGLILRSSSRPSRAACAERRSWLAQRLRPFPRRAAWRSSTERPSENAHTSSSAAFVASAIRAVRAEAAAGRRRRAGRVRPHTNHPSDLAEIVARLAAAPAERCRRLRRHARASAGADAHADRPATCSRPRARVTRREPGGPILSAQRRALGDRRHMGREWQGSGHACGSGRRSRSCSPLSQEPLRRA